MGVLLVLFYMKQIPLHLFNKTVESLGEEHHTSNAACYRLVEATPYGKQGRTLTLCLLVKRTGIALTRTAYSILISLAITSLSSRSIQSLKI
jgi:hypothetical protein